MSKEIIKESGLRMVEITEGHGDSPTTGQTVSVHYEIFFGEGTSTSNYDEKAGKYVDTSMTVPMKISRSAALLIL